MAAFGTLFHDDATFVNVAGACMCGREEIERVHAVGRAGPFRSSLLNAEGQVRDTLMTLVIEGRDPTWKIIAAHNSDIVAQPD